MKTKIEFASKAIVFISFELICIGVIIWGITASLINVLVSLVGVVLSCIIIKKLIDVIQFKDKRAALLCMVVLCCFVKMYTVCFFQPVPVADYNTYYEFAIKLSEGYSLRYNSLYIALFSHVFGYAEFLSFFFLVFGDSIWIAVVLNVLLSVLSMVLIFKIADRIGGERMAVICSVLWTFFPSQSLWNGFVLSEPLYVTELLFFWYLCLRLQDVENKQKLLWMSIDAGGVLVLFNMSRPVGIIAVIALVIWFCFLQMSHVTKKQILSIGLITGTFLLGCVVANWHIESRIGYRTGGFNWYSVSVGLEEASVGKWNQEDWDLILTKVNEFEQAGSENPAYEAQMLEKERALVKIRNMEHPWKLLYNKFNVILGNDNAVIEHMQASGVMFDAKAYKYLGMMVNGFYFMIVVLSILGGYKVILSREKNSIAFIMLYTIGLTIGHMLVEVQGRYHYSILVGFIFAAGYGITSIIEWISTVNSCVISYNL